MKHKHDRRPLIDLGAVTVETKGPTAGKDDHQGGFILVEGLSDE